MVRSKRFAAALVVCALPAAFVVAIQTSAAGWVKAHYASL